MAKVTVEETKTVTLVLSEDEAAFVLYAVGGQSQHDFKDYTGQSVHSTLSYALEDAGFTYVSGNRHSG